MKRCILLAAAAWLSICAPAPGIAREPASEGGDRQAFVAAAHPLAVEAGVAVLRQGGNAMDAAIAIQAMLGLVEPQSSGLGGGAFMVYFDASTKAVVVYDGRETAPAGAAPDMFLDGDGKPLPFRTAVLSGQATGVPGVVAMLSLAHSQRGKLRWKDLFGDAERVARDGFVITPRLERFIHGPYAQARAPDVERYFSNGRGGKLRAGDRLRNPDYAAFVRRLATEGPDAFYRGTTALHIVSRLRQGNLPGSMTEADLAAYRPVVRQALCNPYRIYILCTPPPPSSGAALLQMMAMIEQTDIGARGPADAVAWVKFAEASRLMYADRDAYIGDVPDVPLSGLLDRAYVVSRAASVTGNAGAPPAAGRPLGALLVPADATNEVAGTSHFVIVDGDGNAVSMTTTVESYFGSGRMVDGFFLNNQMTDFSFVPSGPNAIAPGKRPRSSMSPLIILNPDRSLAGAIGSPGGNSILAYVSKALIGAIEWKLPMDRAVALPNLVARGSNVAGEASRFPEAFRAAMAERGIDVKSGAGEDSGLHGVLIRGGRFDGAADPRRDGIAITVHLPLKE